jgi:hypothetical protein
MQASKRAHEYVIDFAMKIWNPNFGGINGFKSVADAVDDFQEDASQTTRLSLA